MTSLSRRQCVQLEKDFYLPLHSLPLLLLSLSSTRHIPLLPHQIRVLSPINRLPEALAVLIPSNSSSIFCILIFLPPNPLLSQTGVFWHPRITAQTKSMTTSLAVYPHGCTPCTAQTPSSKPVRMISTMFPLLNFSSLLTSPACLHMTSTSRLAA